MLGEVRVIDVKDFLHKKVKLKNGLEGVLLGLYQDTDAVCMSFAIEYWCSEGKKEGWYKLEEFEFIEE